MLTYCYYASPMQYNTHSPLFISFQITWARLEDDRRPYSVLTIGDSNYVEDKRFIVLKPRKNQEVRFGLTASSKESVNLTENVGEYYGGDRHEIFTD